MILSMVVLFGWPVIYNSLFGSRRPVQPAQQTANSNQSAASQTANSNQSTAPQPGNQQSAANQRAATQSAPAEQPTTTEAQEIQDTEERKITVATPYWHVVLSNRGATVESWVLNAYKDNGNIREIRGADNNTLHLIPTEIPEDRTPRPFSLRLPDAPDVESLLKAKNFKVEVTSADGQRTDESNIDLTAGGSRAITFTYESIASNGDRITAAKTFEFRADQMYFDVKASVTKTANNVLSQQPVQIVLGPRFGDQSDAQVGSYSTPSQVVTYSTDGKREYVLASGITASFATIKEIRPDAKQIVIDKQPEGPLDQIKIVAGKNSSFVAYARVVAGPTQEAKDRFVITLDALPEGVQPEQGVAHAVEIHNKGYRWAAMADHYFAIVAVPEQPFDKIALTNVHTATADKPEGDYPEVAVPVNPGSPLHIFVGPKDSDLLATVGKNIGTDLTPLIDYGFFSFLVRPLVPVLHVSFNAFYKLFHNYGWAIVFVTVLINLVLSPLRFHSSKKMKKAAKHQPRLKELQEKMKKLKDNPKKNEAEIRKLQEEQLAIMKEANPLGGCLPLLLQLPIFWAVYLYLQSSLDVRHAPWLGFWIKDLSRPDPTYVLPIVMCVTMIASTKLTPQPAQADPSMKMQRTLMTWVMPIMLTYFFFFNAPSGLVLYWMVSNIVGVAIQLWINKRTAEPAEAVVTTGKTGGAGSGRGAMKPEPAASGKARPKGKRGRQGGAEAEGF